MFITTTPTGNPRPVRRNDPATSRKRSPEPASVKPLKQGDTVHFSSVRVSGSSAAARLRFGGKEGVTPPEGDTKDFGWLGTPALREKAMSMEKPEFLAYLSSLGKKEKPGVIRELKNKLQHGVKAGLNHLFRSRKAITPLHAHVSPELQRLADAQYQEANAGWYVYAGGCRDYAFGPGFIQDWPTLDERVRLRNTELSVLNTVQMMMARRPAGEEMQLLDIGCGQGAFISSINAPGRMKAYGITAGGLGPINELPPEQRIQGNAHNLLSLLPDKKNSFDFISSQMTFMHLPDPLGVLTQAYELLKPGGLLLVDGFRAPGFQEHLPQINQYLAKKGCEVYFFKDPSSKPFFPVGPVLIRKSASHPVLDLPVKYDTIEGDRQTYRLDTLKIKTTPGKDQPPPSLDEAINQFTAFRRKIGLTDECLCAKQDPQSQAKMRERLAGGIP